MFFFLFFRFFQSAPDDLSDQKLKALCFQMPMALTLCGIAPLERKCQNYLNISLPNCLLLHVCFSFIVCITCLQIPFKDSRHTVQYNSLQLLNIFTQQEETRACEGMFGKTELGLVCEMNVGLRTCRPIAYNTPHSYTERQADIQIITYQYYCLRLLIHSYTLHSLPQVHISDVKLCWFHRGTLKTLATLPCLSLIPYLILIRRNPFVAWGCLYMV